jgi:hypothetical protein
MISFIFWLIGVGAGLVPDLVDSLSPKQTPNSKLSPPTSQTAPCCIDLNRDVFLDQGSDLDVVSIERARHDPRLLLASWRERFFVSSDGGDKWKEIDADAIDPLGYGVSPPHPRNANIMYRIVEQRQKAWRLNLERSSDGGRTWTTQQCLLNHTNLHIDVSNIVYHPMDPNIIYAYGGPSESGEALNGIYLSRDGGRSFVFVYGADSADFAISASNPDVIYAVGTSQSIVMSTDGGDTWHLAGQNDAVRLLGKQANQLNIITDILVDPRDWKIAYLVSSKGIIRTTDGGTSWCNLDLGGNLNTSIRYMALSPVDNRIMFAGTSRGLFRSKAEGCGWEKINILDRLVK